ncbi:MAG: dynamin family protein [Paracoccaceae bacterium]
MNAPFRPEQACPSTAERRVGEAALVRLARAAARRPRVVVLGEFSAGKSSLVNLLVGRSVAPTQVTATHLPPCRFVHDPALEEGLRIEATDTGGRTRALAPETLTGDAPREWVALTVRLAEPLVGDVEILDPPGLADPLLGEDAAGALAGRAEIAVWCTPAIQAWRQSEKAAWLALPARLRARAVLAVTQTDRLAPLDVERVLRRLRRETEGLFATIVPMATPMAMAARARAQEAERAAWQASGAAALFATIEAAARDVRDTRARLLSRYRADVPATAAPTPAHEDTGAPAARQEPLPTRERGSADAMVARRDEEGIPMKDQVTDISALQDAKGFVGACIVDSDSGLMLGSIGGGSLDLETAGAGNTEVVRAKLETMRNLGLDDAIEDILITLGTQYHLIRPLEHNPQVFIYLALDKKQANLGMARMALKKVESQIRL